MDTPDYQPLPGQAPFKLPPKAQPVTPPEPADPEPLYVPDATLPAPTAFTKLPPSPKFVSPMPKIAESPDEVPSFFPVIAGIAAVVTLAFAFLIYLKR